MATHHETRWHIEPQSVGMDKALIEQGLETLLPGIEQGLHPGAQVYISRHGKPVVEFACGEARPGVPMSPDHLTMWYSSSKPLTALAIAILYDKGLLQLDDPVQKFLPNFAAGKERCTVRHVLTHTGGFPQAATSTQGRTWEEIIALVSAHPAEYEPGTQAGYHMVGGWFVLGEIVQMLSGTSLREFLQSELFDPIGMGDTFLGIPESDQTRLGDQIAHVALGDSGRTPYMTQAFVDSTNNPQEISRTNPSGGGRGPARDLGRFYEMLLAGGSMQENKIVEQKTVDVFTACHRWGMQDHTLFKAPLAWGLGMQLHGNTDIHKLGSRRLFGHSGMVSSVGFADPTWGLVCVVITTGLLDAMTNARRLREVNGPALAACGA